MSCVPRRSRHVQVRIKDGAPVLWHPDHLRSELLAGRGPPPEALVAVEAPFVQFEALSSIPALLPTRAWLEQAIDHLQQDDAVGLAAIAGRVVAFDPDGMRSETRVAHFLLGLLAQRAGSLAAVEHYRRAAAGLSVVRALAASNLAVVFALQFGDPGAADESLQVALAADPDCLPALLNRLRLVRGLATVGYPGPANGSWADVAVEVEKEVRRVVSSRLQAWLDGGFPDYRCVALLPIGYPPAGLGLVDTDAGRAAAERLLHEAQVALQRGNAAQALVLAVAAADKSTVTRPAAAAVKARAERDLANRAELDRAQVAIEAAAKALVASGEGDHAVARKWVAVFGGFAAAAQQDLGDHVEAVAAGAWVRQALHDGAPLWGAAGVEHVGRKTAAAPMLQEFERLLVQGDLRQARVVVEAIASLDAEAGARMRPRLETAVAERLAVRLAELRLQAGRDLDAAAKDLAELRETVGPGPELYAFEGWTQALRHQQAGARALVAGDLAVAVRELGAAAELFSVGEAEWGEVMVCLLETELRGMKVGEAVQRDRLWRAATAIRGGRPDELRRLISVLEQEIRDSRFVSLARGWAVPPRDAGPEPVQAKRTSWFARWRGGFRRPHAG